MLHIVDSETNGDGVLLAIPENAIGIAWETI